MELSEKALEKMQSFIKGKEMFDNEVKLVTSEADIRGLNDLYNPPLNMVAREFAEQVAKDFL